MADRTRSGGWGAVLALAGITACGAAGLAGPGTGQAPGPEAGASVEVPAAPAPPQQQTLAVVQRMPRLIDESSSLVRGRRSPDLWWTHNDSGGHPRLYGLRDDGSLAVTLVVEGAKAVDWEAMTADDAGHLWVGDVGNNDSDRKDLRLYKVAEPVWDGAAGAQTLRVPVLDSVGLRYADQRGFGEKKFRNFDLEAIFWDQGTVWALTKHRRDTLSTLYRFDALTGEVVLQPLASVDVGGEGTPFGGMVTAADLSPDGRRLAVLTYHAILVFSRPEGETGPVWFDRSPHTITLDAGVAGQCEGIAWHDGMLWFTNEDGRQIHPVPGWDARVTYP